MKTVRALIVTEANKTAGMSAELFAKSYELAPDPETRVAISRKKM